MLNGISAGDEEFDNYIEFCVSDKQVKYFMEHSNVCRSDLEGIYKRLLVNGAGQWAKGHFVAASSITYVETLTFIIASDRNENPEDQVPALEMTAILMDYWNGKIPIGGLYRMLGWDL